MFFTVLILIHYNKIRYINCTFSCQWITIRYLYCFTCPVYNTWMVIAETHKCMFPTTSVSWKFVSTIFLWIFHFVYAVCKLVTTKHFKPLFVWLCFHSE